MMLGSSITAAPSGMQASPADPEKLSPFEEYLRWLSGQDKEMDCISLDHCYARSWASHPDSHHAKPTRLLFMKTVQRQPDVSIPDDLEVDVETVDDAVVPPYDNPKTRALMNECDQFLNSSLDQEPEESEQLNKRLSSKESYEEKFEYIFKIFNVGQLIVGVSQGKCGSIWREIKNLWEKSCWTSSQKSLYKQVIKILQNNHLSRLASVGTSIELVKRKIMIDKAARRVRQVFATNAWDMSLLCWLHQTLMDSLSAPMLSEYFEILRALKAKIPNLIDKLLARVTSFHSGIFGNCSTEAFSQLLRKPWDPVLSSLTQNKPKKLPGNPLLVIIPGAPNQTVANQTQRMRFINNQLGSLGKVVHSIVHSPSSMAADECLDHIFSSTRSKVAELKNHHPARPIVLVGWMVGGLIASHVTCPPSQEMIPLPGDDTSGHTFILCLNPLCLPVFQYMSMLQILIALEESVTAVVCFGFPLKGVNGCRGDLDDPLLNNKVPTLFLIGQNASMSSVDDMEDFREKMIAETGLVVVGGADDMLRVSVSKKKAEGVTQSMVDRCLVDEVGEFLGGIVNQQCSIQPMLSRRPYVNPTMQSLQQEQLRPPQPQMTEEAKRQRRRPREYSPELSPVKRKPKPTGYQQPVRKPSPSSSSDTSSTGSCANERTSKREKKKASSRRVGRPTSSLSRKRQVHRIVSKGLKTKLPAESQKRSSSEPTIGAQEHRPLTQSQEARLSVEEPREEKKEKQEEEEKAIPQTSKPLEMAKTGLSFVTQQKNDPVDVEKAFGRDSSFLPRPLTPTEMDQSDLPTSVSQSSTPPSALISALSSTVGTVAQGDISPKLVSSSDKKKVSFLQTASENFTVSDFSTSLGSPIAVQKPQVVANVIEPVIDAGRVSQIQKMHVTELGSSSPDFVTLSKSPVNVQSKLLATSGLTIKQVQNTITSLAGKSLISATTAAGGSGGLSSKPQTILVTPTSTARPTTYLMTSPDGSITTGSKTIQLRRMVVKSPGTSKLSLPFLSKLSSIVTTSASANDSSQQNADLPAEPKVCNLSLLSDVAGMKEPIRQAAQEVLSSPSSSSSATLVKLSSPSDGEKRAASSPSMKRFRLIDTSALSQPPQVVETPEEYAEKQMAIQALNSSLNEDDADSTLASASSYSKSDGASVPRPFPVGYSVVMPKPRDATVFGTRIPYRGGRGRGGQSFAHLRKPRVQRFYPF